MLDTTNKQSRFGVILGVLIQYNINVFTPLVFRSRDSDLRVGKCCRMKVTREASRRTEDGPRL